MDQVAIYSSPNGSEPVYSEVSAENVKLIQSQEDTEFYQVIIIEGERETAIGYIKEEDVIKQKRLELKYDDLIKELKELEHQKEEINDMNCYYMNKNLYMNILK